MRRVVVTGLGLVTPLACGVEETWSRLLAGESGAGPITRFDPSNVLTSYACEIPFGDGSNGTGCRGDCAGEIRPSSCPSHKRCAGTGNHHIRHHPCCGVGNGQHGRITQHLA